MEPKRWAKSKTSRGEKRGAGGWWDSRVEIEEEDAGVGAGRGGYKVGAWPPMRGVSGGLRKKGRGMRSGLAGEEELAITWGMRSRRMWHFGSESGLARGFLGMGMMVPPQLPRGDTRDKTQLLGVKEGTS